MTAFEFTTAQRIKFGPGSLRQLGVLTRGFGQRVALVTGGASLAEAGRLAEVEAQFKDSEIAWLPVQVTGEPTVELIDRLCAGLTAFEPEAVVGIGGGSVLDAAKALAALLANGGSALDYLEGVGGGATLSKPSLPCIAVPTTAGTGSEATRNAVIGDEAKTFKKSMRSATMLPALALIDPDLIELCPQPITAACGMDALAQLIEAYTSPRSSPITDSLALQGIGYAAELPFLASNPQDSEAREGMALASLFGGMCLANAGLGAVHGLASPLGAFFEIPHGVICAALLPGVLRFNIMRALEQEQPELILKYSAIFEILAGYSNTQPDDLDDDDDDEDMEEADLTAGLGPREAEWEASGEGEGTEAVLGAGEEEMLDPLGHEDAPSEEDVELTIAADNAMLLVQYLADLRTTLRLPGLREFGVSAADFERIIAASGGNSMQTNAVKLTPEDLHEILDSAL